MTLTKEDLGAIQGIVKTEITERVAPLKTGIELVCQDIAELKNDIGALREAIQSLTVTLDKFLKRLLDLEEEFTILKTEMKQVKQVLKEKLGVDFKGAVNW